MARFGIVSDIHGNLDALYHVLHFLLAEQGAGELLCLGDIVGYNAEPDACVELLEQVSASSVAGNHDLIAIGALGFERCALRPAFALSRTREVLGAASRRALEALPRTRQIEGDVLLVHGGILDVCEYMTTPARVEANDALMRREHPGARICLFGHTHEQKVYEVHHGVAVEREPAATVYLGAPGRRYFVNPGSVDASRKEGERFAECAVFDSTLRTVSFHRVAYDHELTEWSAALHGYRMTPVEERVRGAIRGLDRRRRGVLRRLHGLLRWSGSGPEPGGAANFLRPAAFRYSPRHDGPPASE